MKNTKNKNAFSRKERKQSKESYFPDFLEKRRIG